jgi:hypothetical protein
VRDVSSAYAQKAKSLRLERLDRFNDDDNCWEAIVVEDRHAGPFDITRFRIDFADWLTRLPAKRRRIAKFLAGSETTAAAAEKFRMSAGRISQIRSELRESWRSFVGDGDPPAAVVAAKPAAAKRHRP